MFLMFTRIPLDVEVQKHLTSLRIDEWLREDIFHLRWWFLIIFFIISVFVWCKLVDKSRLFEIGLFAVFIIIIVLFLDEFGEELTLWDYPTDVLPLFPPIEAINMASFPMIFSLIYQHFRTWKSFIIANTALSAIFCFLLEPLFIWLKIYQVLTWRSIYGFPIYIAIPIIVKLLIIKVHSITEKHRNNV